MKFTLSWLKDHLDTSASLPEIRQKLDQIGLEVEGIDDPSEKLGQFTIARVLEAKRHPQADRLQVLQVEIEPGKPSVEVVCGAPNARAGLVGVFAPLGAYIPGTGITLEKKPVRGVVSNGMMLSEREMELSDDHAGIVDLDTKMAENVGKSYVDVLGLSDPVIEIKLTPNRPDCTGVRGVARDLAAAGLGTLKPEKKIEGVEGTFDSPVDILLEFPTYPSTDTAPCSCFAGRYIKGIKNGTSPAWMQTRIKAIGLRPINAVVDVTNYIMIDRGRPLHVYDADKLKGAIRARLGKKGESFLALNERTYEVDETMCVIADAEHVHDIGGIMGGEDTGCTPETKNVLIECAYFDPVSIATTGRKLGLVSDARYRFERGVDPAFIEPGLDLATRMMLDIVGGTPSKKKIAGKPPIQNKVVEFDFARVEKLMGVKIADAEIRRTLEALGFGLSPAAGGQPKGDETSSGAKVKAKVPSWRPDVHGPADLVEEVARIAGLESVPSAPLPRLSGGVTRATLTDGQRRVRRSRRMLAARGFVEAVTWSFIDQKEAGHFGGGTDALQLANPISSEMTTMRPGLLPGLLAAAHRNHNRGFADLALFEVGQAYKGDGEKDQLMIAAGLRTGASVLVGSGRDWQGAAPAAGVFDVKADAVALLAALGVDASKAQVTRDAPAWYHPGRSATLRLGPKTVLAHFGELHPATLKLMDVSGPAAAFEVFLDALPREKKKSRARAPLAASDLLPVTRDFAFLLDRKVAAGDVAKAAHGADKSLISAVKVFDVFEGASLGADKKSLAIEVTLTPTERTLTDDEIDTVAKKVIAEVKRTTGGEIRG
ncbi:MAG: phenylalanine--tRNA ligase subunit beta [Proteobacteria bacterium]|nr:phenylalanine--tRNA ligase subunit beta [Pseudomonadota bacterium]